MADALARAPGTEAHPARVAAARRGELAVVNAAWWGLDPDDSTGAMQGAIDTHAPSVVVPDIYAPWVLSEWVQLVGHQTLLLEEGVELSSKLHSNGAPALLVADLFSPADPRAWESTARHTGAWSGMLLVRGCRPESGAGEALRIEDKSALSARLRLETCVLCSSGAPAVELVPTDDERLRTPVGGRTSLPAVPRWAQASRRLDSPAALARTSSTCRARSWVPPDGCWAWSRGRERGASR